MLFNEGGLIQSQAGYRGIFSHRVFDWPTNIARSSTSSLSDSFGTPTISARDKSASYSAVATNGFLTKSNEAAVLIFAVSLGLTI